MEVQGVIQKPCGHGRGRGLAKCPYCYISLILQNDPQRGEGVQKYPKNCPHGYIREIDGLTCGSILDGLLDFSSNGIDGADIALPKLKDLFFFFIKILL